MASNWLWSQVSVQKKVGRSLLVRTKKCGELVVYNFPEKRSVGSFVCYSGGVAQVVPVHPRQVRELEQF